MNEGFKHARHPVVLSVNDSCPVHADSISMANQAMLERPEGIVTGQVRPAGDDPRAVPSTIVMEEPRDFTGQVHDGVLYSGNMVCPATPCSPWAGSTRISALTPQIVTSVTAGSARNAAQVSTRARGMASRMAIA